MRINDQTSVRFKGFLEKWKENKISDLATFSKGSGYSKSDLVDCGTPILLYGQLYTNYKTIISSVNNYVIEKEKSVFSCGNEVVVPASGESSEDIARASAIVTPNIIIGGDLNIIRPMENIEPAFLALSLSHGKTHGQLKKLAQGKSVVHLQNSEIKKVVISYPSINEQIQISSFFKSLDDTISLHQQELEALKQTKQGFLQKMFPRDEENIPEVRFLEFTNKWNAKNLKSVFKDFIVPMRDKPREFSGDIPWTRIEDIEGRYLNGTKSGQFVSENTVKSMNLKVIPKGALIVSASATFGIVAIVNTDVITNQTFIGLVPNEEFDLNFLYSLFQSTGVRKKLKKESAGSTIFYISRKQFEGLVSYFPEREEQVKIGEFFRQLDEVIELKEKEIEALKQTKKGFLQKMFV